MEYYTVSVIENYGKHEICVLPLRNKDKEQYVFDNVEKAKKYAWDYLTKESTENYYEKDYYFPERKNRIPFELDTADPQKVGAYKIFFSSNLITTYIGRRYVVVISHKFNFVK